MQRPILVYGILGKPMLRHLAKVRTDTFSSREACSGVIRFCLCVILHPRFFKSPCGVEDEF